MVNIENGLLDLLMQHNAKVDSYSRKFSSKDTILKELSSLPILQSEELQMMPTGTDR